MCLIVFAWKLFSPAPLFVAANRDEFYARPTEAAHRWKDSPSVFAGRDLQHGGTWMGVSQTHDGLSGGRFAAITNFRDPQRTRQSAPTRGKLVSDFLESDISPQEYIEKIRAPSRQFNGFNLLVGDCSTLIWFSNYGEAHPRNGQPLSPGIYGLSNALLDNPWHKVVRARAQFASLLAQHAPADAYFEMLSDTAPAPDALLPNTGVGLQWERILSPMCVVSPQYGTRASTLVQLRTDEPPVLNERLVR
ncbi:MAG: NRDE family protein [Burkholderiaceae bacterium]|jgi:uncharacterized protein with NRDE domain|nr:NRDE family protein [Burkholderiaceae bacterium]